jgi:hypothetical protein
MRLRRKQNIENNTETLFGQAVKYSLIISLPSGLGT